eukprot:CAMPEP_0118970806 /NCGR_PEP_ID=MMETSP1173-20130426/7610_1 /TAXON_ID=1034831 /ORGANISM="Rhizochromulina marina cf, Strain CCMP1243" /LENGTH=774 /DNA_ID=CAMNT_0006920205 /DNA_START=72 /DNA_END=2392 /DNA_ORIENTATION=-
MSSAGQEPRPQEAMDLSVSPRAPFPETIPAAEAWHSRSHATLAERVATVVLSALVLYGLPAVVAWVLVLGRVHLLVYWLVVEVAFFAWVWGVALPSLSREPLRPEGPLRGRAAQWTSIVDNLEDVCGKDRYSLAHWLSGWFEGAPAERVKRGNFVDFVATVCFNKFSRELTEEEAGEAEDMTSELEARLGHTFPPGYEPGVVPLRFFREPLGPVYHRPLLFYGVMTFLPLVVTRIVFTHVFRLRRVQCPDSGLFYWYRPCQKPKSCVQAPLVLFHGLCGFTGYMAPLSMLLRQGRGCILVELEEVSMRLVFHRPATRSGIVQAIEGALRRHFSATEKPPRPAWRATVQESGAAGEVWVEQCCVLGHSLGSILASWLLQDRPHLCHSIAFVDPICLLLELPDVAFNFLYAQPRLAWRHTLAWLMHIIVSTEPGVAYYFRRRFFWYNQNILPGELTRGSEAGSTSEQRLPKVPLMVALSERDELASAPVVRNYVLRHVEGAHVVWWPRTSHTEFMLYPSCWRDIASWMDTSCGGGGAQEEASTAQLAAPGQQEPHLKPSGQGRACVDAEPKVETGVAKLEKKLHEGINLVLLSAIFVLALSNLAGGPPGHSSLCKLTLAYTFMDSVWIAVRPKLVPGQLGILVHHSFVMALLIYSLTIGKAHAVYSSSLLLVELNTSLNMLRRLLRHPKWCEILFLVSWLALRLVWIPAIAVVFVLSASGARSFPSLLSRIVPLEGVNAAPVPSYVAVVTSALAALQFYWTFALGRNVLKRAFGAS